MPVQAGTKSIMSFGGKLTRISNGDSNSGMAKFSPSFGYDPFTNPGKLTWYEAPIQIDSGGAVVTDLILKSKNRVESGTSYVYSYGYNGQFYKTTVSTDTPVLVADLHSTATMKFGGGMEFFNGASEKVYLGHDSGLLKMAFDGTGQTAITSGVTWVSNVPRPIVQFLGKIYIGNDVNLVEIDSTELVTSGTKLSPSLPTNWHIVDLDVTPDGNYLIITARRLAQLDVETSDPTNTSASIESAVFYWNGSDNGYNSFDQMPSATLSAVKSSIPSTLRWGSDFFGAMLHDGSNKLFTLKGSKLPLPGAAGFNGQLAHWCVPETSGGHLQTSYFLFGGFDIELPTGLYRPFQLAAQGANTDTMVVGSVSLVSSLTYQSNSSTPLTTARIYFSTYETGGTPTAKFYKWLLTPTGSGTSIGGVYETQNDIFPEKVQVKSVRFYVDPTVTGNGFQMDLIGSDGNVISGTTKTYTYTAGTNPAAVQGSLDLIEFANVQMKPVFAVGIRITNTGTTNMVFNKLEYDFAPAGR